MGKQYKSHRRASIMNSKLRVRVHCRQQFRHMVKWLVDEKWEFGYRRLGTGDSFTPETYELVIRNIHWATNLVTIAERLARYDYDSEGEEERDAA